jgi:DNA (cytosine-5)-methyltransferase 1
MKSIEICAGAGGQALGLERAGFKHIALVEYEQDYCNCLKKNRMEWNVICEDVHKFDGTNYKGIIDLLSGGVPCPPFSIAGKQLGMDDDRDLFPQMLRLVKEIEPKTVMIENVRGLLSPIFSDYRAHILSTLSEYGYNTHIKLLNAADFNVPQARPRVIIVAIRDDLDDCFEFPEEMKRSSKLNVGNVLYDLIKAKNWKGAKDWKKKADRIAPTIVGGSKKHGGPDLGPTRSKKTWAELGIDGNGIADEAPSDDFVGMPKLTPRMIARIQGFPDDWDFGTRKTLACRMIGNAFPPPVAEAVGNQIRKVLEANGTIIS